MNATKKILTHFFENYSKNVDNAGNIGYWKLSDTIIMHIIQQHLEVIDMKKEVVILDAGCGTGCWIKRIIELNPKRKFKFIAYDLFDSMLGVAREKLSQYKNVLFIQGDLQDMSALSDNSIDFCISIYSPISFVERPELMIQEIGRVLKKNATALIMGHSFHNALDSKINNFLSGSQELDKLYENHKVQWNDSLPLLHTFSIEDFQKLGNKHNLFCDQGYGITIYAKPTNEDWDSSNVKIGKLSHKLREDEVFFHAVLKLELENNSNPTLINRGVNILAKYIKISNK